MRQSTRDLTVICLIPLCLALAGCGGSDTPPADDAAGKDTPAKTSPADTKPSKPAEPQPADLLARAKGQIAGGQLDDARSQLAALHGENVKLSADEQQQLGELESQLAEMETAKQDEQREAWLVEAKAALAERKLEAANTAIQNVLNAAPGAGQREQANELKLKVQERQKVRRDLMGAMQMLASTKRSEVRAAQARLRNDAADAFPLLCEALHSEDPVTVGNALELLRIFNEPERTMPEMIAVLSRVEQQKSWPAAIQEIQKLGQPGAGQPLLDLALKSPSGEVRAAALEGLAAIGDPPPQTLLALLPSIHGDGPELAAALVAARHAVQIHHQYDLTTRRGLDAELTAEQEKQIADLPERLAALAGKPKPGEAPSAVAQAASGLAAATRLTAPKKLTGLKVIRFSGEDPASPASAAADGAWDTVDLAKMWRQPGIEMPSIALDLGEMRTVTGVRIWNFNEPAGQHRGWKEVDVFVSETPTLLTPVAEGIVPLAPGVAEAGDYSLTIPVPFVRGRYIKLQARSVWRRDASSGLTEIEVQGY